MTDEHDAPPKDPAALRALVEELRRSLAERDAHIAEREKRIHELEESLVVARERAEWFQRRMFGRSSEKIPPADIEKLLLEFGEIFGWETAGGVQGGVVPPGDVETDDEGDDEGSDGDHGAGGDGSGSEKAGARVVPVRDHQRSVRSGHGRKEIPEGLPRVVRDHELAEEERLCEGCGEPKERIGSLETKLFEFLLPLVYMLVHSRAKYACKNKDCEGTSKPVTAPLPLLPIHKGKAGPGMLAQILIGKFLDHLPLFRQQQIFLRHGVEIARSTLGDWVAKSAALLAALAERIRREVLASDILQTDDTTFPVLPEPTPGGRRKKGLAPKPVKKGHLWAYCGDEDHPYVAFHFTENWSARDGPEVFLKGFKGSYMQADAYKGYDAFFKRGPTVEVACWAHARRKVHDAYKSTPSRAKVPLALIQALYRIEREAKDKGLDHESLRILRQEKEKPILDKLRKWLDEVGARMSPKSLMGQAVTYMDNQWEALGRYLEDGRLAIDNNDTERVLRHIATGRKSWVFAGSNEAANRAADVYTVIMSAKRCGIEPHGYLRHLLSVLPHLPKDEAGREEFLGALLPDRWALPETEEDQFLSHLGPDVITAFLQSLTVQTKATLEQE